MAGHQDEVAEVARWAEGIATRLASEGANVAVSDVSARIGTIRPDGQAVGWRGLASVTAEIEEMGRETLALFGDISDGAQVDDMVGQTLAKFGRIDILVNNAAFRPGRSRVPIVDLESRGGSLRRGDASQRAPSLTGGRQARCGGGKIINMSSVMGKRGVAMYATYSASKFAIIGFTQAMAQEMAPHRVNVNTICPGLVDTERVDFAASAQAPDGVSSEEYRAMLVADRASRAPMGRIAQTDDIARMAAFLASSESDYITGLSISVSGGLEMN